MEDYNKVLEATSVAENANGVAAEKMTVYNESLEAAQNRLTASVQQFAQDSNLDRTLALAYDGLSKVVEILNILLNKIPVLSPLIKALGVALSAAFAAGIIEKIVGTSKALSSIVSIVPSVISSLSGAGSAAEAFGSALYAAGGPIGVILGLLGAIVAIAPAVYSAWQDIFPSAEQKAERSRKALEESNAELDETNSKISETVKQIQEIDEKGTLTLTDEVEKDRLEEQLDLLKQIRENQEAINKEKNKQALSDEQAKAKEMTSYNQDEMYQYQTGIQTTQNYATAISSSNINELIAAYKQLNEEKKNLNTTDEDYAEQLATNQQLTTSFTTKLLEQKQAYLDEMKALAELGDTSSDTYKNLQKNVDQINATLDPSKYPKLKIESMIDTDGSEDKIKAAISKGGSSGFKELKGYADKFAQDILSDKITEAQWKEALGIPSTESLGVNELSTEILNIFQQMFNNISESSNAATEGFKNQQEAIEAYNQAEADLAEQTDILTVAYSEMNNQGHLNSSTVTALKKQYPELTDALITQNGQVVINTDTLQNLTNSIYDNEIASITAERNKTLETINQTRLRIAAYNAEITALEGLVKAGDETAEFDQNIAYQHREDAINQLNDARKAVEEANAEIDKLNAQRAKGLQNNNVSGVSKSKSSGTSAADKAAKEFENEIKDKVKNLKSIVELYSENANWDDPSVIKEFQGRYDKLLDEVINDPKARKVLADVFNLDISDMPVEKQIQELTTLWQKQAGTILESYQKLLKNLAKEDLNSAKAIINAYKEGVYGAWSSQEAFDAAEANYSKFIEKITNDADYRAAMADALNLGDISAKSVEEQVELVTKALLKSTGTLEDAQQELYDKASKNIKALQDKIEDMLDTAIGLLEKAGDFLFDVLGKQDDIYQKQLDNLDKIKTKMSREKEDFEDQIDKQKEKLKLEEEELKKKDELKEKNKDIADIDAQLLELQYDNSKEAQAKRLKLLDERAKAEKKLKKYETETSYDTKTDALEKEKKDYEERYKIQERMLEDQKTAIEDAKKAAKDTLDNTKKTFDYIIKILNSDFVKNLISKALINSGSDTVTNLLTGYNKLFGTGIDSDVTGTIKEAYKSLKDIGGATETSFVNTGKTFSNVIKNMASSGGGIIQKFANGAKGITSTVLNGINTVFNNGVGFIQRLTQYGINSLGSLGSIGSGIISNLGGVASQVVSTVIQGGSKLLSGIGGIVTSLGKGIGSLLGIGGTAGATGAAAAGGAAATAGGAGLLSTLGTAGVVILGGANAIGSIGAYWKDTATLWKNKDKNFGQKLGGTLLNAAKMMIPGYGLYRIGKAIFGKHHSGSDYVKKQNPMLDKMLGLGNDETVSILKVGEAVVPTWANNATPSSSSNRFTGSPFGNAVDTAVKSTRVNTKTYSSSDNSSINISMPINIQGDADASTVNSLKKEADNIVNKVLRTINNQTRLGGYKNIKAATI